MSKRKGESAAAYKKRHCADVCRQQKGNPRYLAYQARYRAAHLKERRAEATRYAKVKRFSAGTRRKVLLRSKLSNSRVRAKRFDAPIISFTLEELRQRWKMFASRCAYCNGRISRGVGTGLCIDHVKPLSEQGPHHPLNVIPACGRCSCQRNRKPWLSWFRAQPFYSKRHENRIRKALKGD